MAVERVKCFLEDITTDDGKPGIRVECSLCEHGVEACGRESKSVRYALARMREECPEDDGDAHFYVAEDEGAGEPMPTPARKMFWEK